MHDQVSGVQILHFKWNVNIENSTGECFFVQPEDNYNKLR